MKSIESKVYLTALGVVALALATTSGMVILKARSFEQRFGKGVVSPTPDQKLDVPDFESLDSALGKLDKPTQWLGRSLLGPDRYVIDAKRNLPANIATLVICDWGQKDMDIPRLWFEQNHLPADNPEVNSEDPDHDGFSNEDEWLWRTDPNDPQSHPPYYRELFLIRFIKVPFRVIFQAYEGDMKNPAEMTFQITTVDRGKRKEVYKLGETLANSPWRLASLTSKTAVNPRTQDIEDASELTMSNTETGDRVALPLSKLTDLPDCYALFIYEWNRARQPIQVKIGGEFVLAPKLEEQYRLISANDREATILTPAGEKVMIGRDRRVRWRKERP